MWTQIKPEQYDLHCLYNRLLNYFQKTTFAVIDALRVNDAVYIRLL